MNRTPLYPFGEIRQRQMFKIIHRIHETRTFRILVNEERQVKKYLIQLLNL